MRTSVPSGPAPTVAELLSRLREATLEQAVGRAGDANGSGSLWAPTVAPLVGSGIAGTVPTALKRLGPVAWRTKSANDGAAEAGVAFWPSWLLPSARLTIARPLASRATRKKSPSSRSPPGPVLVVHPRPERHTGSTWFGRSVSTSCVQSLKAGVGSLALRLCSMYTLHGPLFVVGAAVLPEP